MKSINLNGWQRIWVVCTLLWFGFNINFYTKAYYHQWVSDIETYLIRSFYADPEDILLDNNIIPTNKINYNNMSKNERDSYRNKAIIAEGVWLKTKESDWESLEYGRGLLSADIGRSLRDTYLNYSNREIVDFIYSWRSNNKDLESIKSKNRGNLIKRIEKESAISVALAPPLAIYLIGILLGWIRKGFKNPL